MNECVILCSVIDIAVIEIYVWYVSCDVSTAHPKHFSGAVFQCRQIFVISIYFKHIIRFTRRTNYVPFSANVTDVIVSELKKRSANRVSEDKDFMQINKLITRCLERQNDKTISLNENVLRAEEEELRQEKKEEDFHGRPGRQRGGFGCLTGRHETGVVRSGMPVKDTVGIREQRHQSRSPEPCFAAAGRAIVENLTSGSSRMALLP
jgi:hypothetical protein